MGEANLLAARGEELLKRVTGGPFLFGAGAYAAVARVLLASGAPERGETLLRPVLAAARRSGWHEVAATTERVIGLSLDDPGRHLAAAAATIERMTAGLKDDEVGALLHERAKLQTRAVHTSTRHGRSIRDSAPA